MKIFLSYNDNDQAIAQRMARALSESGADVWTDSEILPGDNWAGEKGKALDDSDAMIVLITPSTFASQNVRREIEYALGQKQYSQRLIPCVVGNEIDMSDDQVPWILRSFEAVHLPDPEDTQAVADEITRLLGVATS